MLALLSGRSKDSLKKHQGVRHLASSYVAAPAAIVAVAVGALVTAVNRRLVRWWNNGHAFVRMLIPEEDLHQNPGAVSQAATATATGLIAEAEAAAATPAILLSAAGEVIGSMAAALGVVCSTAAAGATAGHDFLYPPKRSAEQQQADFEEFMDEVPPGERERERYQGP